MRSLRRTLSVRFSITMFVALVLIGTGAFLGGRPTLSRLVDESLESALALQSAPLAAGLSVASQEVSSDSSTFIDRLTFFVAVRDSAGRIVATNTPWASDLPLAIDRFEHARAGATAWSTDRWPHGRVRSIYTDVPEGSRGEYAVVQVAASIEPLSRAGARLMFFTVFTVVLATGATAVGAGWLAKSSLAPVGEITCHAAAIDPETPGKRISAHADTLEFQGLVAVLNSMLEGLEAAIGAQRRLVADVGHELRTPITSLQGNLEVALRGSRTESEYRTIIGTCLEETEHLASINETLLLLARLEAGEWDPAKISVDVREIVESAAQRARTRGGDREYVVHLPEEGAVEAVIDSHLLRLVLDRLLDNTIDHAPPGTRVHASVRRDNSDVVVAIDDDGPGPPEDLLPHLFDRFYRADPARPRARGAGLGLSIAAAVARIHDGSIAADRSDLGGLRIMVRLPRGTTTSP